ncbi:MAG: Ppx/GppA family phosphatase [Bifidobacteriaceae bacterium]|jgi:exopolyphosphatase/guanosine-5'-triphosphate,3'-diphosphate pyrophosphatase|nr:Ppx/GppA family phosphatase [Bifidobacteriaceae bacterium]
MGRLVRAAGIDCGTNSIRLLVGDVDVERGTIRDVERLLRIVRLGEGVDATGRLAPAAIARTEAAVRQFAHRARQLGAQTVRMVATSAARDAENRGEFTDAVRAALGVAPEVLDGLEEAALTFAGALTAVRGTPPFLVADLGGGSTELVLGAGRVEAAWSMDVGCVRMTERRLPSDPPTEAQLAAAAADVDQALDRAGQAIDFSRTGTLVGVAGTVTSRGAYAIGLREYDPARIDGTVLQVGETLAACRSLAAMTRAQRTELGFLEPGRVDVIGGGAVVWSRVVSRVRDAVAAAGRQLETVTVSEHDILDGVTLSAALRLG